jgi:hypothetical protein
MDNFMIAVMSADSQVDGLMVNKDEGCAALIGRIF